MSSIKSEVEGGDESESKNSGGDEVEISNEIGQLTVTPSPQTQSDSWDISPSKENNDGPTATATATEPATSTTSTASDTTSATPSAEDEAARAARRAEWPLMGITEPGINDCLFGRGGGTNHHPGNKRYRKLVEEKKAKYLSSKRLDKPLVAMEIINEWRALDPPGRFLKQDEVTKLWNDVGEKKAREKTSQALREKTPVKQREGQQEGGGYDSGDRTARFQPGTSSPTSSRFVRRSNLARNHSLGTEIVGANEISLDGFSWEDDDEPIIRNNNTDVNGQPPHGERYYYPPYYGGGHHDYHGDQKPPPPPYSQHVREHSLSTNPLPNANVSRPAHPTFGDPPIRYGHNYPPNYGPMHPLPPPHAHHHAPYPPPPSSYPPTQNHPYHSFPPPPKQRELRTREHSLQMPLNGTPTSQPGKGDYSIYDGASPPPPPPPPPPAHAYHRGPPPPPPHSPYYGYGSSPDNSWPSPPGAQPSPQFAYQVGSNPSSSAFGRYNPMDRSNSMKSSGSGAASNTHSISSQSANSAASSSIDPASAGTSQDYTKIAELFRDSSDNSSTDLKEPSNSQTESRNASSVKNDESAAHGPEKQEDDDSKPAAESTVLKSCLIRKLSGGGTLPSGILRQQPINDANIHRPEAVKRDTSNQTETVETKRSIKRVVLSRDQSEAARRLKEKQFGNNDVRVSTKLTKAEMLDRKLSVEMNMLGLDDKDLDRMSSEEVLASFLEESGLCSPSPMSETPSVDANPPEPIGKSNRVTTIDAIALEIANGTPTDEWDDALDLIVEEDEIADPGGLSPDIAEKWLKGDA